MKKGGGDEGTKKHSSDDIRKRYSTDLINLSHHLTESISQYLTLLQVELAALCPELNVPADVFQAGLALFDRFAILDGSTWPFIVLLKESEDRVFMFNTRGLTSMLLMGLLPLTIKPKPCLYPCSLEPRDLTGPDGDTLPESLFLDATHNCKPIKSTSYMKRTIFRLLHMTSRVQTFLVSKKVKKRRSKTI